MGRYRNFRVAICDLRGRLTDMDIKELGLLRDLRSSSFFFLCFFCNGLMLTFFFCRHPNIVRFIGVSLGGAIPCTIVTELCRNGDLYDPFSLPIPALV
ncbi:uncharacterized protein VP01_1643g1 [Puccinia sorghi]|uniref:Uncharacterized protein n=1 Tax=Puccinia sorghi TaxID=27349 RepID=A0A0L6VGR6_9BASI|nr:uncharacterized protein VP01_1643g1 [Puccinia sorghi]